MTVAIDFTNHSSPFFLTSNCQLWRTTKEDFQNGTERKISTGTEGIGAGEESSGQSRKGKAGRKGESQKIL